LTCRTLTLPAWTGSKRFAWRRTEIEIPCDAANGSANTGNDGTDLKAAAILLLLGPRFLMRASWVPIPISAVKNGVPYEGLAS
jgi:hypothetical protein